ncbi:ABC transporter substrate-binding protein [Halosimplex aquaticum]
MGDRVLDRDGRGTGPERGVPHRRELLRSHRELRRGGGRAQPISAFLSGDIEAGPLPQPEHIERIQSDDSKEVVIRAGTAVQGFALNWNTSAEDVPEIYANPKFRQAIAYVLDNEGIGRAHPTRTTALERADGVFFNVEEALPNIHDQLEPTRSTTRRRRRCSRTSGSRRRTGRGSTTARRSRSTTSRRTTTTGRRRARRR